MDRLIRLPELSTMIGLGRSAVYRRMADGCFPRPVKLGDGPNSPVAWRESEIKDWIESRPVSTPQGA